MPKHGADQGGVSRPVTPDGSVGVTRPGTPDAHGARRRARGDEMEPEPEQLPPRAGGGNGRGEVVNYVDLGHESELTASMRPYAKLVQDVSAGPAFLRRATLLLAAVTPIPLRHSRCQLTVCRARPRHAS